jgi:hypothetical protein
MVRDLQQERSLLCVETDGPRLVAERSHVRRGGGVCQQHLADLSPREGPHQRGEILGIVL